MTKNLSFLRYTATALSLLFAIASFAQQKKDAGYVVSGTVYDQNMGAKPSPITSANVSMSTYGVNAATNASGKFSFSRIPSGKTRLSVSYLGKVTLDTLIDVKSDLDLKLYLKEANFRLADIVITSVEAKSAKGTSSRISRTAMDHLQPQSLADVLSLLPGVQITNPDLTAAKQLSLRLSPGMGTNAMDLNAFGTSIILDGAPISNNVNLQVLSPTVNGGSSSMSGGAPPAGGFDVRNISMDNIESVEVIRGVPGVTYGDATSGAVIVNTKAGTNPLSIRARINPNVYQFSAGKGMKLGAKAGALNVGLDYARNTSDPVQQYQYYERATGKAVYSNVFGKLQSTTSMDVFFGKDTRKLNPDDLITRTKSKGRDLGFIFNTRGSISVADRWLRSLNYVAKVGLTDKNSVYETQYTSANAPYSMSTTDGAILSNRPGVDIYDVNGNKLTNIPEVDRERYAVYLPSTYVGQYTIDGQELNTFLKGDAVFFKQIGATNHRWVLGADFKSDKNLGEGKTFSDFQPPYRSFSSINGTFRRRTYDNIPAINQLGVYLEDDFGANIGNHMLNITAGLRYDRFNGGQHTLLPRINASVEVLPRILSLNAAYGKLAKAPSALYLYPEDAYFEYININELASSTIPVEEQVMMTTIHRFNTQNPDLEIAKNEKMELGFTLNLSPKQRLSVTGYREKMNNGYLLANTASSFKPLIYNEYTRADPTQAIYTLTASNPVLANFNMPTNNQEMDTKGVEFDLNLGRIKSLNTAVALNGSWMRSTVDNKDYGYFSGNSTTGGAGRTHIGLYDPKLGELNTESFVTTLRTTHNIPQVGLVVTLATQVVWKNKLWNTAGNDSIPVKYISKLDGQVYDFDQSRINEQEFKDLLSPTNARTYIRESYKPVVCFNLNLTKEVADYMRISFLANNMFRSYPVQESKRNPGTFIRRNNQFFFGLEMALTLK